MDDSDPQPYQNHFCSLLDTSVLDQYPASKRRKDVVPKTVVTVKIESPVGMGKSEGPPSDSWSWRKYGQKPIKGSPFPRGYYRCSTSKGCSAKKQVERCKTDASMLIITYTSTHNHHGPAHPPLIQPKPSPDHTVEPNQIQIQIQKEDEPRKSTDPLHAPPHTDEPCLMQTSSGKDDEAVGDNTGDVLNPHLDDQSQQIGTTFSTPKRMEENDFFDELEELPIHPPCTELMRSSLFDERIILLPAYSN